MCRLCSRSNHFPTKNVYIKSTTVYVPSSEWTLATPLSPASVRGWGGPNSDDWRKSLALCAYSVHFPVRLLPSLSNLKPVCLSACLVYLLICLSAASLLIYKQYTPFIACLSGSVHQLNCRQACLFILFNYHYLPVCIFACSAACLTK